MHEEECIRCSVAGNHMLNHFVFSCHRLAPLCGRMLIRVVVWARVRVRSPCAHHPPRATPSPDGRGTVSGPEMTLCHPVGPSPHHASTDALGYHFATCSHGGATFTSRPGPGRDIKAPDQIIKKLPLLWVVLMSVLGYYNDWWSGMT